MSENRSNVEANLELKFKDTDTARSIMDAVSPDNVQIPEGIDINMDLYENVLSIKVSCSKSVGSMIATLDDLLSCIQAAEKTLMQLE